MYKFSQYHNKEIDGITNYIVAINKKGHVRKIIRGYRYGSMLESMDNSLSFPEYGYGSTRSFSYLSLSKKNINDKLSVVCDNESVALRRCSDGIHAFRYYW